VSKQARRRATQLRNLFAVSWGLLAQAQIDPFSFASQNGRSKQNLIVRVEVRSKRWKELVVACCLGHQLLAGFKTEEAGR
jgi:hypothetical protein